MTREEAIAVLQTMEYGLSNQVGSTYCRKKYDAVRIAIKALKQEPSREFEDYENCKECRKDWTKCGTCSVMMQWLKDNKQEPCEDAISRAYIEPFVEELENICINGDEHVLDILSNIKNAPSVTPQQKVGKWIRIDKDKLKCSECEVINYIAQYPQSANINYCPNCGTKMEEEEC